MKRWYNIKIDLRMTLSLEINVLACLSSKQVYNHRVGRL